MDSSAPSSLDSSLDDPQDMTQIPDAPGAILSRAAVPADCPNRQLVVLIQADQRAQWDAGNRVLVEAYLREFPALREDREALLDLIYGELLLARQKGGAGLSDTYVTRFPDLRAPLERMMALDSMLSGVGDRTILTAPPDGGSPKTPGPPTDATIAAVGTDRRPAPVGYPTAPPIPNHVVGDFIAGGGMGAVYHARHVWVEDDQRAVKVMLAKQSQHAERTLRFLREAKTVLRFTHPNIVRVYDCGTSEEQLYLVMEYVSGGSLAQRLADPARRPSVSEAARILSDVLDGLAAVHDADIIHRDLKPGNILLTASGAAKITDFGLARTGESILTVFGSVVGTPAYMAPEQARGHNEETICKSSDLWAVGVILYECLTGKTPFRGSDTNEILSHVVYRDYAPVRSLNPAVPVAVEAVCDRALNKDPEQRYATAREMRDALRRAANLPEAARPEPPRPPSATPSRLWPIAACVLAAVALTAVTTAVSLSLRASQLQREAAAAREALKARP